MGPTSARRRACSQSRWTESVSPSRFWNQLASSIMMMGGNAFFLGNEVHVEGRKWRRRFPRTHVHPNHVVSRRCMGSCGYAPFPCSCWSPAPMASPGSSHSRHTSNRGRCSGARPLRSGQSRGSRRGGGQDSGKQPTFPSLSRNITRFSPSSRIRLAGESGVGNSFDGSAGIQYSRIRLPMGVPGPTLGQQLVLFPGEHDSSIVVCD